MIPELAVSLAYWSEPPEVESMVIVFVVVFVDMVILLPGTIDSISVGDVARINEEFTLIVEKEFVLATFEPVINWDTILFEFK